MILDLESKFTPPPFFTMNFFLKAYWHNDSQEITLELD